MSTLDPMLKPTEAVRRLEVITGTGRRRRFSADDKARVVEETLVPGAVVSDIARRHGLTPQQVFTWRRQARQPLATIADIEGPQFVAAVVHSTATERDDASSSKDRRRSAFVGVIEVEIAGVAIRVGRGADEKTIAAVLHAVKAAP